MTAPLVQVTDLRVEVGGRTLLDGVHLRAYPGRVTALLGASGCGKTTTGLALLGEYPEGAKVSGTVLTPAGAVGYVPQHPATVLNPARRIGALLGELGPRSAVEDALRRARLDDPAAVLRRFPHQLSGGQQQRVVIAQALLFGARVLVADEPTTGQDPETKRHLVTELAALVRDGLALVLLSHDLDVVRELADEVVMLRGGRVVRAGAWDEVPAVSPRRSAEPTAPVLAARHLTARHPGGALALADVTLTLGAGECLALTGRSGSGKTTLGRCLAGLHSAYQGTVTLDGRPLPRSLRSRSRAELAAVQYVFQDARAAFDERRPVAGQVARAAVRLGGLGPAEADGAAARLLAELGVPTTGRPAELSGGELQRAALARALVANPRVLVCDEITSGLDALSRRLILDHLAGLRDRTGLALLLITHDRAAADILADRTLDLQTVPSGGVSGSLSTAR
ncbi:MULTISPECIES: ABC transporter ATP-binding protein [unclassified Kitasatospora]|uniref:ABC transporter ATP-binding protein n=1 Tax=unclassified Kitasatospora TaxID=2633591 RepID=UPI00070F82DC|nr:MULTISPECIES: ATP-binding cassette domain-containing protein [unclassified Kitasatospora]KQV04446.1 peptide ABC transporter ATP-binding protein [Kitasatospora sp. Root107]KRB61024.1 peptide ABC transporter ATP-binding protein [Kitasatospora sp. Root187]